MTAQIMMIDLKSVLASLMAIIAMTMSAQAAPVSERGCKPGSVTVKTYPHTDFWVRLSTVCTSD